MDTIRTRTRAPQQPGTLETFKRLWTAAKKQKETPAKMWGATLAEASVSRADLAARLSAQLAEKIACCAPARRSDWA